MTSTRPLSLVTGGSSGIGFELAAQFAEHGYDVAISGRSERVFASADRLTKLGVEAYAYQGDAATFEGVEGFWEFTLSQGRPVAAAALNVGIGRGGAFVDNTLEDEFAIIAVNITGTVHMAKRVVQHMVRNGDGKILIVSSVSATTPTPFETVYGPSKAFGYSFAESIREELRGTGVSVTALLPGATNSDFHANAGMGDTKYGDNSWKNDKTEVARQGFEALMNGEDHVVGGDEATKQVVIDNRTIPEAVKAAHHAKGARPNQRR
ncbi:3-oxoacyl-[acyl-carrier-protein] reductase FabG [Microbacterium azadirachtae]|uniref:3-oxoacyl-[acyl-carrier-protein] reductase FabG n=1 Tax=Microbacterium azadirachtae TaxID=582680 RepID=A0A0F0KTU8_9MICO|nr:SDR family NAD(P)-dependent oxidoreductase [Microbacterium azadirachtae]KJL24283.1 3-oxoacyl-[acyl-carrier-protein] reductase FabG [Microbacterium azadirachtae]